MNNVFLNDYLDEDVYTTKPPGFISTDTSLVCKLNKAIYGLKQAPRAWYDRLTKTLINFGFEQCKCDPSLLIFNNKGCCIYMLIYVDDIILTGSSPTMLQQLITKLDIVFSLKQLDDLDYFFLELRLSAFSMVIYYCLKENM